ncbi:MAG: ABC transporter permease subunit [Treponema sp.]|nr:ABC transporter permease subunit [Treponema sp.]
MKTNKAIIVKLMISFILLTLCMNPDGLYASESSQVAIESVKDIEKPGIRIGMDNTLNIQKEIKEKFPNAEIQFYNAVNGMEALKLDKLDVFIYGEVQFKAAKFNGMTGIKAIEDGYLLSREVAFGVSKYCDIPNFEEKVNDFVDKMKRDGTIERIYDKWIVRGEITPSSEMPRAKNPTGTITVGTIGELVPFSFYSGSDLTGAEIEIAYLLAEYLGVNIEFSVASWDGLISGLSVGKFDLVASCLYIDESRKKGTNYSIPYFEEKISYLVKEKESSHSDWISQIKYRIHRTLIENDRWKTLISGFGTTLIITFGGFFLANILGAIFCAMLMSKNKVLNSIASLYIGFMQGMPIVVLLMIIYYIIFGKTDVSGVVASIVGFGLMTGADLSLSFKSALHGVDKGQWEAAYSLGFSKSKTFFGVIFPQAAVGMLPIYFSQLIALMKGTAVVGYVAVMDLTKMGDVIRSATFDAVFSLIIVAIIYLLMAQIMIFVSKIILKKVDPVLRKRLIKGVKIG